MGRVRVGAEQAADAVTVTSMLPRVAFEYGQTSWAPAARASAVAWSTPPTVA